MIEPTIRACYDKYLDVDGDTLAWIMAIDGLYLLRVLSTCDQNYMCNEVDPASQKLTWDVVMLENQIPAVVLKEIQRAFQLPDCKDDQEFFSKYLLFCKANSPLKLTEQSIYRNDTTSVHLLSHMYKLIVNNKGIHDKPTMRKRIDFIEDAIEATTIFGELGGPAVQRHLMFAQGLPWQRILALFDTGDPPDGKKMEEIGIPSVSQLCEIAKIKFKITPRGIRDVKYDEEGSIFYLPAITLDSNSEVILRYLLAYEALAARPDPSLELAEYVDLMCGVIDTAKDVEFLRNGRIIQGVLTNEEIAAMFNRISQSTVNPGMKNNLVETIDKVNQHFSSTRSVMVWRFIKNNLVPSEKFLKAFLAVLLLFLLSLQSFFHVYGCSTHWFGKISSSTNFLGKVRDI